MKKYIALAAVAVVFVFSPQIVSFLGGIFSQPQGTEVAGALPGSSIVTISVNANPTTVNNGGSAWVSWSVTNAKSCHQSGGWAQQNIPFSGTKIVTGLSKTTDYVVVCTDNFGNYHWGSATVKVNIPTPSITITANPTTVKHGGSTYVSWSVTNAKTCNESGQWVRQNMPLSGGTIISVPIALKTSTYTITCVNDAGTSASKSVTITELP